MELTKNFAGVKAGKLIFAGILSLVSIALAMVIFTNPGSGIALVLALFAVCITVRRPVIGILLVLVSTSTIVDYHLLPMVSIAGVDIHTTEVLILIAFITVLLKNGIGYSYRLCIASRITAPLLIFFVLVIISIFYSFSEYPDLDTTTVIARSRHFFYYILFFPTLLALREEKDLRFFINGLLVLTVIVSIYFIFTALFGWTPLHYYLKTGISTGISNVDTGAISNLRLRQGRMQDVPGTALVMTVFFVAIGLFVYHYRSRKVVWYGFLSTLFTIPILLTFTRTTWATTLAVFPIFWMMARKRTFRFTKLVIVMGAGFLIGFLSLALYPKYSEIIEFSANRFRSFFEENVETSSAVWRIVEMKAAMEAIEENPLFGMGVAGEFERKSVEYNGKEFILIERHNVHNAYMTLAMKIGIPALAIFLILYFTAIVRAFRAFKRSEDLLFKGILIGLFLGLLRSFLNAFSQPYFIEVPMVPCLAISFALIEAVRRISDEEVEERKIPGKDLVASSFHVERGHRRTTREYSN